VRPRRPATGVPDLLFSFGSALLVMAVVIVLATFFDDTFSNDNAGTTIGRLFAGALTLTAVFAFLIGILLLRGDRAVVDHYVTPLAVGALVGVLVSWALLSAASPVVLAAPLVLFLFALRPVRRLIAGAAGRR